METFGATYLGDITIQELVARVYQQVIHLLLVQILKGSILVPHKLARLLQELLPLHVERLRQLQAVLTEFHIIIIPVGQTISRYRDHYQTWVNGTPQTPHT